MKGISKSSRFSIFMALGIMAMFLTSSFAVIAYDDIEPNDDFYDAVECYDGDVIYGDLDDVYDTDDFYMIQLYEGDYITLTLEMDGYDFDLYLYDPYEWEVSDSTYSEWYESIYYYVWDDGYHYIQVEAVSGVASYELTISVIEGGGGPDELWVGGDPENEPVAEVPEMNVGDSVYWGGVKDIIPFIIIIIVMVVKPYGLFGEVRIERI